MSLVSYYEALHVSRQASPAEIETAYRQRMFAIHPDRSGDRNTAAAALLNHVIAILRNPYLRADYDRRLADAGRLPTAR